MMRPFSDVDLHAFVDGQINPERRGLIDAYLKATPAEAARVDMWRRQNEALRSVFGSTVTEPVPLWLTINHVASGRERPHPTAFDVIQDNRRAGVKPGSRSVPPTGRDLVARFWKPACIVAAAFLTGLAVPTVVPEWPSGVERWLPATPRAHELQRLAARTLEAHRTFGTEPDRPVEILDTPPGALSLWLKRHVSMPARVPDLSRLGWTLRGARVVPGDRGAGALLVYESPEGDRLSLMMAPVENPAPANTATTLERGPTLVWLDGPIGFGVATSREGAWLGDNARALYRAVYEGGEG